MTSSYKIPIIILKNIILREKNLNYIYKYIIILRLDFYNIALIIG